MNPPSGTSGSFSSTRHTSPGPSMLRTVLIASLALSPPAFGAPVSCGPASVIEHHRPAFGGGACQGQREAVGPQRLPVRYANIGPPAPHRVDELAVHAGLGLAVVLDDAVAVDEQAR